MESIRKNFKWYLLATLFLANVFVWHAIFAETRNGIMTVAFLDVGQGDAIFIEAPGGNQMLVDGGPNRSVLSALSDVMPFYDRSIDVVIATHPDADHIGGLPAVLSRYDVRYFIEPGVAADTGTYRALVQALRDEGAARLLARRGMEISLGGGAALLVLFPDRNVSGAGPNDASIVAKLVYGETSFLLTGDAPERIENFLAFVDEEGLDVDVLKVGHHGSDTSTGEALLGYSSPAYAVISAGEGNRYGHPHESVLESLEKFGAEIRRTDLAGSVIMKSDGESILLQ